MARTHALLSLLVLPLAGAVHGQTHISGNSGGDNTWNDTANWDNGVPNGSIDAVVMSGLWARVNDASTPSYSGQLTLENGATLTMAGAVGSELAVDGIAGITMQPGSRIELNISGNTTFPPIVLQGDASLATLFGASDWEHSYYDTISGAFTLTLDHFNGHNAHLTKANSMATLVLDTLDRWRCYAEAAGCLGTGDVFIQPRADGRSASLHITVPDTMNPNATLHLGGTPGQGGFSGDGSDYLVLDADLTVGGLVLYGQQMATGTYDSSEAWISGAGTLTVQAPTIGTKYCGPANTNSSGGSGDIQGNGYPDVLANELTLSASGLPVNETGLFVVGETQGFFSPPGSQGNLCLGGKLGRFASQISQTGAAGSISIDVDLNALPVWPNQAVLPGDTWYFQAWFTDGASSNFSDALSVTFN